MLFTIFISLIKINPETYYEKKIREEIIQIY